jgi:hypothetical protein
MKPALMLTGLVLLSFLGFSQDIQVREEAVRLLEQANAVGSAPNLPIWSAPIRGAGLAATRSRKAPALAS